MSDLDVPRSTVGTFRSWFHIAVVMAMLASFIAVGSAVEPVVNAPPVAVDDFFATDEDVTLAQPGGVFGVLGNDWDAEGGPLEAEVVDDPAMGILTLRSDGGFDYVPYANLHGTDTFTYRAYDGTEYSNVATATIDIASVNDPPQVLGFSPLTAIEGEATTYTASVIDNLDGDLGTALYEWEFGDGSPVQSVTGFDYMTHTFSDEGSYTACVQVTDAAGAASNEFCDSIEVLNAPPSIGGLAATPVSIEENESVLVTATVTDPGPSDYCDISINWNEPGLALTLIPSVLCSGYAIAETHQYLDDHPSLTKSDTRTITVTVTDSGAGSATETVDVIVNNVDPMLGPIMGLPWGRNPNPTTVSASVTFTDQGTQDTHDSLWDWNDSAGPPVAGTVTETNGSGTAFGTHTYTAGGAYPVVAFVIDDDTGYRVSSYVNVVINRPPTISADPDTQPVLPGETLQYSDGIVPIDLSVSDPDAVLYRVNAGGPTLMAYEEGPAWMSDAAAVAAGYLVTGGDGTFAADVETIFWDATVPLDTRPELFQTERYDPDVGDEMIWSFPAQAGETVEVRLYFSEIWSGAQSTGSRVFDVSIEGDLVLDHFDQFAQAGARTGTMTSFVATVGSDDDIDILFEHVTQNPAIKAIEILRYPDVSLDGAPGWIDLTFDPATACLSSGIAVSCSAAVTGIVDDPAGTYTFDVVADDGLDTGSDTVTLNVVAEDAVVSFDGDNPVAVQVDSPGSDASEPFDLTIYVEEVKEKDDPRAAQTGATAWPGDLTNAVVTTTLQPVGPGGPATGTCVPGSVTGSGYDAVLEVNCSFDAVPVNTYIVSVTVDVDGYYAGYGEDVLVVYDPSLGFTTGGGWFYWPGTTDRTNFGYTMKYNKKATNIQGSLLLIRHTPSGEIYRIKSNALYGLAIGEGPSGTFGWASFSGKSTYRDPTMSDPEGNHEFIVYVEDWGVPGAGVDRFWIEVHEKNSGPIIGEISMDRPATKHTETIEGGNIYVPHPAPGKKGPRTN